jgi:hypothetical protein
MDGPNTGSEEVKDPDTDNDEIEVIEDEDDDDEDNAGDDVEDKDDK